MILCNLHLWQIIHLHARKQRAVHSLGQIPHTRHQFANLASNSPRNQCNLRWVGQSYIYCAPDLGLQQSCYLIYYCTRSTHFPQEQFRAMTSLNCYTERQFNVTSKATKGIIMGLLINQIIAKHQNVSFSRMTIWQSAFHPKNLCNYCWIPDVMKWDNVNKGFPTLLIWKMYVADEAAPRLLCCHKLLQANLLWLFLCVALKPAMSQKHKSYEIELILM